MVSFFQSEIKGDYERQLRWIQEAHREIPVAPGVEHFVLDTSLDEVYFALQWLESNLHLSLTIWMEDWASHGQHMRKSEFPIVIREFSLKS